MKWPWTASRQPDQTLLNRIDDLESTVRRLKVEWEDVLDRLERIMGRLNKREQRARSPVEARTEGEATNGMDPISLKVWARRQAHVPHRGGTPPG